MPQEASQALGQPFVIDNRPGADGAIGADAVIKSPADGYTLFLASSSALSAMPALRKNPPYDPIADFTPILFVGRIGVYVFVNPSLPVSTLAELVAYARANPGKLNYGTGHATGIFATAQLMSLTKIEMVHVPYKGDGAVMADLLAGRLQLSIASPVPGLALAKAGKMRVLATLLSKRSAQLPSVPTMAEAGFPEHSLVAWAGLFGPANLPREIVERLSRELNAILRRADIRETLERQDFEAEGSTPEELASFVKLQLEAWRRTGREAGIQPD